MIVGAGAAVDMVRFVAVNVNEVAITAICVGEAISFLRVLFWCVFVPGLCRNLRRTLLSKLVRSHVKVFINSVEELMILYLKV